jgi:hypothetical protein
MKDDIKPEEYDNLSQFTKFPVKKQALTRKTSILI